MPLLAFNVTKGRNSRTVNVKLPKFVFDLSFGVKSIVKIFMNEMLSRVDFF